MDFLDTALLLTEDENGFTTYNGKKYVIAGESEDKKQIWLIPVYKNTDTNGYDVALKDGLKHVPLKDFSKKELKDQFSTFSKTVKTPKHRLAYKP
jgi:hypothetical protein